MWILKWHIEKRGSKMCNTYLFHRTYFTDVVFLCWYEPDPNILQLQVSIFEGWIMRPEVKFLYSLRGTRSSQSFILTTTKEKKPELTHPPVRWVIIRIPVFSIHEGRVAFWYLCRHDMNQQSYGFGHKRMKKRDKTTLFFADYLQHEAKLLEMKLPLRFLLPQELAFSSNCFRCLFDKQCNC